jgi:manganese/iron transport system permease protein
VLNFLEIIGEPLGFDFMKNALIIIIILGGICAVTGSYLIVQKMGLLGDVIAHAVLPGLAIAYYLGIDIFVGAFISGICSSLVISWIQGESKIKIDVAMALAFSGFLALGILLITLLKSKIDLHSFLFGDILAVKESDLFRTLILAFFVIFFVKIFYKELLFYTFNPLGAKAMGLPVNWLNLGLISAITLTIIASMQAVGVVLVVSLLVGPSITAYLLVKELHQMMILGSIIGSISGCIGIYLSYYFNLPSGPAIVLVVTAFFIMALLFSPSQGILTRPTLVNRSMKVLNQLNLLGKKGLK